MFVPKKTKVPAFGPRILISDEILKKGEKGIRDFIINNKLDNFSEPVKEIVNTPKSCGKITLEAYYARWHEMKLFAFVRGDYQSATILDRVLCPRNPLPVRPELLVEYYQYKVGELDEKLYVAGSTTVYALDVLNNEIFCADQWHSKVSLQRLRSAIFALHDAYAHLRVPYMPVCVDCLHFDNLLERKAPPNEHEKVNPGTYGSCQVHANSPMLLPRGNTATAHDVIQAHNTNCIRVNKWIRKGSVQLLPGEIRQLRDYLTSSGNISDFQLYVMILVGIKLFLRAEELLNIKVEDFPPDFQIVNKLRIKSIAINVQGKSDLNEVHLHLYCDNECTEFCPVRHLLVYMAWSGITSGLIFPDKHFFHKDLKPKRSTKRSNNPLDKYKILYSEWLCNLRRLFKFVLKREVGDGRLGTHTLRKTGYLFAVWGVLKRINANTLERLEAFQKLPDLLLSQILSSARHKSVTNASTYQMDSATLYAMVIRENNEEHHRISNWTSICFTSVDNARTITQPSAIYQQPLHLLSIFYMEIIVQLKVDTKKITIKEAIECARNHNTIIDKKSELNQVLAYSCTPEIAEKIKLIVEQDIQQQMEERSTNMYNLYRLENEEKEAFVAFAGLPIPSSDITSEAVPMDVVAVQKIKKLTKRDTNSLEIIERFKFYDYKNTMDKLDLIIKLYDSGLCTKTKDMVQNCKNFYLKNVPRIAICIKKCHYENKQEFANKVGLTKFKTYNYTCDKCGKKKPPSTSAV